MGMEEVIDGKEENRKQMESMNLNYTGLQRSRNTNKRRNTSHHRRNTTSTNVPSHDPVRRMRRQPMMCLNLIHRPPRHNRQIHKKHHAKHNPKHSPHLFPRPLLATPSLLIPTL